MRENRKYTRYKLSNVVSQSLTLCQQENEKELYNGILKDISRRGILFESLSFKPKIDDTLLIKLNYTKKITTIYVAKVIRIKENNSYGCVIIERINQEIK